MRVRARCLVDTLSYYSEIGPVHEETEGFFYLFLASSHHHSIQWTRTACIYVMLAGSFVCIVFLMRAIGVALEAMLLSGEEPFKHFQQRA